MLVAMQSRTAADVSGAICERIEALNTLANAA